AAAAQGHFGAARCNAIECGEALMHAHRVIGGQHGDGRNEFDPLSLSADAGQDDVGRRDGVVGTMVLTDADDVDADLICQDTFGYDVSQHFRVGQHAGAPDILGKVPEDVESEFHDTFIQ